MTTIGLDEAALRLAMAVVLAGIIGFEREVAHKNAGLRTHVLVGLGAALFTLLGAEAIPAADPARVAAQVVTGIGFLGAGVIFRHGMSVQGLTTAAGLWTAAALGMASALGEYEVALIAAGLALATLLLFRRLEWAPVTRRPTAMIAVDLDDPAQIEPVRARAIELCGGIGGATLHEVGQTSAQLRVSTEPDRAGAVMVELAALDGVGRVYRTKG